ncbi:hypothetical protein ACJA3J_15105 [Halobacillus sp. SY10]|uniref:hypothetical protein n=1 Tax=Halobacillus sp. SY10 TaxID=3381356 RepID=UPI00387A2F89
MLISKLDEKRLAQQIARLPLASHQANHKWVRSTVNDYILPSEDNLEGQYIVDLFKLTTPEIIEKWFDGEDNAYELLMR